jgi:hypothetical protein
MLTGSCLDLPCRHDHITSISTWFNFKLDIEKVTNWTGFDNMAKIFHASLYELYIILISFDTFTSKLLLFNLNLLDEVLSKK